MTVERCGSTAVGSTTSRRIRCYASRSIGSRAPTTSRVGTTNPMYRVPRTQDELREQMDVLLTSDRTAATTAGCMALATAADLLSDADPAYGPRLEAVRSPLSRRRPVGWRPRSTTPRSRCASSSAAPTASSSPEASNTSSARRSCTSCWSCRRDARGRETPSRVPVPVNTQGVRLIASTTAPRAERRSPPSASAAASASPRRSSSSTMCSCRRDRVFLAGEAAQVATLAETLTSGNEPGRSPTKPTEPS